MFTALKLGSCSWKRVKIELTSLLSKMWRFSALAADLSSRSDCEPHPAAIGAAGHVL